MKKKLISMLLATAMVVSLVGCGGGATEEAAPAETTTEATTETKEEAPAETTEAAAEEYKLESVNMVVNGTLTATVDNGQADFEKLYRLSLDTLRAVKKHDCGVSCT